MQGIIGFCEDYRMGNEELSELKREIFKDIDKVRREYKSFKSRTCVIANLFIPGIGFILYGGNFLKGIISFAIFILYNLFFLFNILPHTDIGFIYFIPSMVIWVASTAMVAALDD